MNYDNKFDLAEMAFEDYCAETDMPKRIKLYYWQQIEKAMERVTSEWDINDLLMKIRFGNFGRSIGFNWNPPSTEEETREETKMPNEEVPGAIWNSDPSHNYSD